MRNFWDRFDQKDLSLIDKERTMTVRELGIECEANENKNETD